MKELFRLGATLIIWAALSVILTSSQTSIEGWAAVLALFAGMASTAAVWTSGANAAPPIKMENEKAKRDARVRMTRMVQQMDDDELAQLSDLLSQNDAAAGYNERLSRK